MIGRDRAVLTAGSSVLSGDSLDQRSGGWMIRSRRRIRIGCGLYGAKRPALSAALYPVSLARVPRRIVN